MSRFHYLPEHLPIDDLPIEIPLDWSPEQALAALEWLPQLQEQVWMLYAQDIQEMLRDRSSAHPPAGNDDPPL